MTKLEFTPRSELTDCEWSPNEGAWKRLKLEAGVLKELSKRSNLHGLVRVCLFTLSLAVVAATAIYIAEFSLWLAIPLIYVYYFLYGFWVAIGHELQHKTVFDKSLDWFSEIVFYVIQALMWNSPRYARISHRLHHRYTMVRGKDPETDWADVFDSDWVGKYFRGLLLRILIIGAFIDLYSWTKINILRALGKKDWMMHKHCSDKDIKAIRIESVAILTFHLSVAAAAVGFWRWEPIVFITLAWFIGAPIEGLWHSTEHIGRLYNVNDFRLCTRSVRVNPLIHLIYGGLDDHVDHHLFPGVPSRNLPNLHRILKDDLPEPKTMVDCWREIFAIAREKDNHPYHEYVPKAL